MLLHHDPCSSIRKFIYIRHIRPFFIFGFEVLDLLVELPSSFLGSKLS